MPETKIGEGWWNPWTGRVPHYGVAYRNTSGEIRVHSLCNKHGALITAKRGGGAPDKPWLMYTDPSNGCKQCYYKRQVGG